MTTTITGDNTLINPLPEEALPDLPEVWTSTDFADRWLQQFWMSHGARRKCKDQIVALLDMLEAQYRSAMPKDIIDVKINIYWFERIHARAPRDDEHRQWRLSAKFNGTDDIGYLNICTYAKAIAEFKAALADELRGGVTLREIVVDAS